MRLQSQSNCGRDIKKNDVAAQIMVIDAVMRGGKKNVKRGKKKGSLRVAFVLGRDIKSIRLLILKN